MHVALVVPGDVETTSGGFRYDRRLVDSLRDAGDDVSVHSVPWRRYPLGVVDSHRSLPPAVDTDADVVLIDELAHPAFATLDVETSVVALVHHLRRDEGGPEAPVACALERRFLTRVDAAICTSTPTARSVTRLVSGSRAGPLPTLVAPPTDDQFNPDVSPADIDARASREPFRVVALGSVVPRKRPLALVDALAGLSGEWTADFVGPQPDDAFTERLRRRCRRRGVTDRVTLTGPLSTTDVADVLRRSHVLALPSRHEGFGIAYLEGMGFGLPAVATSSGGATDLVSHNRTGFLVPPDGVGSVYAALSALRSDRARLARMGLAARDRYDSHPPWTDTAEAVRTFLARVVDGCLSGGHAL